VRLSREYYPSVLRTAPLKGEQLRKNSPLEGCHEMAGWNLLRITPLTNPLPIGAREISVVFCRDALPCVSVENITPQSFGQLPSKGSSIEKIPLLN